MQDLMETNGTVGICVKIESTTNGTAIILQSFMIAATNATAVSSSTQYSNCSLISVRACGIRKVVTRNKNIRVSNME